jgi:2-polyprenyl-3-methyl-5-hydroxy-6-metoxy-1,4-benzoquinol methylase
MNKKVLFRKLVHWTIRARHFNNKCIRSFAKGVSGKKILELGSGKAEEGFSVKRFFDGSNEFVQSDVIGEYGYKVVDVTKMDYRGEFDIIVCMNVLEHVFDFKDAISNIYNALKPAGTAIISVPAFYPLHDEPNDYWRFTEHSLRKLLGKFSSVKIKHHGVRQYPFAYFVEAKK